MKAPFPSRKCVMADPIPRLEDDLELIDAMQKEMRFVEDRSLDKNIEELESGDNPIYKLIKYFEEAYSNTDQDTVVYGPEFVIVVRNLLAGKRPVRLRFLTDFDGEER